MARDIYHVGENSEMPVEFWAEYLKRKVLLDDPEGDEKWLKISLKNSEYKHMEHRIGASAWSCEDGTEASLCLKAMYMFYIRPRKYSSSELISTWYLGAKTEQFPHRKASVGDFSTFSYCSVSAVLLATCQPALMARRPNPRHFGSLLRLENVAKTDQLC